MGRDDSTSLYQKQSFPTEQDGIVGMAATRFFDTNAKNTSEIGHGNYLIWGDNGKSLDFTPDSVSPYSLLNRKWLTTASGEGISSLPVTVKVKTSDFYTDSDSILYLTIHRNSAGNVTQALHVAADSISGDGTAWFSGIHWDTDRSGSDLFTFAVLPKQQTPAVITRSVASDSNAAQNQDAPSSQPSHLYEYRLYPNPTAGAYRLTLNFAEPTGVTVRIYSAGGVFIRQYEGRDAADYDFSGMLEQTGLYMIRIETAAGVETMKLIVNK